MRSAAVVVATALALVLAGAASAVGPRVARVIDGDTIALTNGQHVRLVQIDTPETHGSVECYGRAAATALRKLLPEGTPIRLVRDPRLDDRDRYGRLLRYVFEQRVNLNLLLVARGDATVWFFEGDRGRYAQRLIAAQRSARRHARGLWKACPGTRADPLAPATTGPAEATAAPARATGACEPGYSPCLPVVDDVDCGQIDDALKPIHVTGADPYRLDADGDGLGCER